MCGRYTLHHDSEVLTEHFGLAFRALTPRYNLAPTERVCFIFSNADEQRQAGVARWGLVPHWSKTNTTETPPFNARSDHLARAGKRFLTRSRLSRTFVHCVADNRIIDIVLFQSFGQGHIPLGERVSNFEVVHRGVINVAHQDLLRPLWERQTTAFVRVAAFQLLAVLEERDKKLNATCHR
jgi:hypothetical protein